MANGNVGGMLTQKVGPLPAWAWAGIAAVGIWFFVIRGRQAAPTGTAAGTPTGQATTDYSLGYAQGIQANAPPPSAAASPVQQAILQGQHGVIWLWSTPQRVGLVGTLPPGTRLPVAGPPVSGLHFSDLGVSSDRWIPVSYGGQTAYVWAPEAQVQAGGAGFGGPGPGTSRKHATGSRSANLWHSGHPLLKQKVHYPHYVNVGGPAPFRQSDIRSGIPGRGDLGYGGAAPVGGHSARMHAIARQAGVHPARVLMLNPVPGRHVRIA